MSNLTTLSPLPDTLRKFLQEDWENYINEIIGKNMKDKMSCGAAAKSKGMKKEEMVKKVLGKSGKDKIPTAGKRKVKK